jgi:hypothetical protein
MNFNEPNSFSISNRVGEARGMSVLTASLDELCRWENLDRLDYVKIDAEGAEREILAGAMESIKRFRPIIQLEISINDTTLEMPDYLGFKASRGSNKVYIPAESKKLDIVRNLGWKRID